MQYQITTDTSKKKSLEVEKKNKVLQDRLDISPHLHQKFHFPSPAVFSGAFEGRGHMIDLSLHPALYLSYHLTHSQRVTAVHSGPVLTHAALLGQTHDTKQHQYTLPSGSFRLHTHPDLVPLPDPDSHGKGGPW